MVKKELLIKNWYNDAYGAVPFNQRFWPTEQLGECIATCTFKDAFAVRADNGL